PSWQPDWRESDQTELIHQRCDVPVGVDRHSPTVLVDLPDICSADVKCLTGRRDARWKPFAGVGPRHPPLMRNSTLGGVDQWSPHGVKSHVWKALPRRDEETASFIASCHRCRKRRVDPMRFQGYDVES